MTTLAEKIFNYYDSLSRLKRGDAEKFSQRMVGTANPHANFENLFPDRLTLERGLQNAKNAGNAALIADLNKEYTEKKIKAYSELYKILDGIKMDKKTLSILHKYIESQKTNVPVPTETYAERVWKKYYDANASLQFNRPTLDIKTDAKSYEDAKYNIDKLLYPVTNPYYLLYYDNIRNEGINLLRELKKEYATNEASKRQEIYDEFVNFITSGLVGKYVNAFSAQRLSSIKYYLDFVNWTESDFKKFYVFVDNKGYQKWKKWSAHKKLLFMSFEPNSTIAVGTWVLIKSRGGSFILNQVVSNTLNSVTIGTLPQLTVALDKNVRALYNENVLNNLSVTQQSYLLGRSGGTIPTFIQNWINKKTAAAISATSSIASAINASRGSSTTTTTTTTGGSSATTTTTTTGSTTPPPTSPNLSPVVNTASTTNTLATATAEQVNDMKNAIKAAQDRNQLDDVVVNLPDLDYGDEKRKAIVEKETELGVQIALQQISQSTTLEELDNVNQGLSTDVRNKVQNQLNDKRNDLSPDDEQKVGTTPSTPLTIRTPANQNPQNNQPSSTQLEKLKLTAFLKGITNVDELSRKLLEANTLVSKSTITNVYNSSFKNGFKKLSTLKPSNKKDKLNRLIAYYYMKNVTENKDTLFPNGDIEAFKQKLKELGNDKFLTIPIIEFLLRLRPEQLTSSPAILGKKDEKLNKLLKYIVDGSDDGFDLSKEIQTYNFQERETIFSDYESSLSGAEYDEYSDTEYGEFISNVDKEIEKILEHSSDTGSYDYETSDSGTYTSED